MIQLFRPLSLFLLSSTLLSLSGADALAAGRIAKALGKGNNAASKAHEHVVNQKQMQRHLSPKTGEGSSACARDSEVALSHLNHNEIEGSASPSPEFAEPDTNFNFQRLKRSDLKTLKISDIRSLTKHIAETYTSEEGESATCSLKNVSLKGLNPSWFRNYNLTELLTVLHKRCGGLTDLNLEGVPLTQADLEIISRMNNLKTLNLKFTNLTAESFRTYISKLSGLQTLLTQGTPAGKIKFVKTNSKKKAVADIEYPRDISKKQFPNLQYFDGLLNPPREGLLQDNVYLTSIGHAFFLGMNPLMDANLSILYRNKLKTALHLVGREILERFTSNGTDGESPNESILRILAQPPKFKLADLTAEDFIKIGNAYSEKPDVAYFFFKKAAEMDSPEGKFLYGQLMYKNTNLLSETQESKGSEVSSHSLQALEEMKKAADQSYRPAQTWMQGRPRAENSENKEFAPGKKPDQVFEVKSLQPSDGVKGLATLIEFIDKKYIDAYGCTLVSVDLNDMDSSWFDFFRGTTRLTDVLSHLQRKCPGLKHLALGNICIDAINDSIFEVIGSMNQLQSLTLSNIFGLSKKRLQNISQMDNLRKLGLVYSQPYYSHRRNAFDSSDLKETILKMPNLTHLDLTNATHSVSYPQDFKEMKALKGLSGVPYSELDQTPAYLGLAGSQFVSSQSCIWSYPTRTVLSESGINYVKQLQVQKMIGIEFLEEAARQGNSFAKQDLEKVSHQEPELTSEEYLFLGKTLEAHSQPWSAAVCYHKAWELSDEKNVESLYRYGVLRASGNVHNSSKDDKQNGLELIEEAAKRGHNGAQELLRETSEEQDNETNSTKEEERTVEEKRSFEDKQNAEAKRWLKLNNQERWREVRDATEAFEGSRPERHKPDEAIETFVFSKALKEAGVVDIATLKDFIEHRYIDKYGCSLKAVDLSGIDPSWFASLSTYGNNSLNSLLYMLQRQCPGITDLTLGNLTWAWDASMISGMSQLKTLVLNDTSISHENLRSISRMSNLEVLRLRYSEVTDNDHISPDMLKSNILKMKNLTHLDLTNTTRWERIKYPDDFKELDKLKGLQGVAASQRIKAPVYWGIAGSSLTEGKDCRFGDNVCKILRDSGFAAEKIERAQKLLGIEFLEEVAKQGSLFAKQDLENVRLEGPITELTSEEYLFLGKTMETHSHATFAATYFRKAWEVGEAKTKSHIEGLYRYATLLYWNYTHTRSDSYKRDSLALIKKAADLGHTRAQDRLDYQHERDVQVQVDDYLTNLTSRPAEENEKIKAEIISEQEKVVKLYQERATQPFKDDTQKERALRRLGRALQHLSMMKEDKLKDVQEHQRKTRKERREGRSKRWNEMTSEQRWQEIKSGF